MKNKLDKVLEENPELMGAVEKIAAGIMPHILETLILSETLDKNRLDDTKYVWQTVIENLDVVDGIQRSYRIDNELMESAKDAAKLSRISVTVILVATSIEHILNMFYRDALEKIYDLSEKEVLEVIRNSAHAKLGWMLKIVSDKGISENLEKRIKQIIELRNGFIHYKSIATSLNEQDKMLEMVEKAKNIGIETILNTPAELESELSIISADIFPELETSKKIVQLMFQKPKEPD